MKLPFKVSLGSSGLKKLTEEYLKWRNSNAKFIDTLLLHNKFCPLWQSSGCLHRLPYSFYIGQYLHIWLMSVRFVFSCIICVHCISPFVDYHIAYMLASIYIFGLCLCDLFFSCIIGVGCI
jgi:hypothetical protein